MFTNKSLIKFKYIYIFLYNLITEILTLIWLKLNYSFRFKKENLTFAMLKNSWVNEHDSKKRLNYTYTNKHYSSLNDRDFYLLTILRNNDDKLMELKFNLI